MKILILGAGGIVGQYLKQSVPDGHEVQFHRLTDGYDLTLPDARAMALGWMPDVVLNLAGEARVDVVEGDPPAYELINVHVPAMLAQWCAMHAAYYVHVSTQAVFSGLEAPYAPGSKLGPINAYGRQKAAAELAVVRSTDDYCIARLTFCLGIRTSTGIGRPNPLEHMLLWPSQRQVSDRYFSVSFGWDAAAVLWNLAIERRAQRIEHIGHPIRFSRYSLARHFATAVYPPSIVPVLHDEEFSDLAPRPLDTTWAPGSLHVFSWLRNCRRAHEELDRQHVPKGMD